MSRKKYAIIAAGFLLNSLPRELFKKVKGVILFGSVATETATSASDVDLFFDVDMTKAELAKMKRALKKAVQDFYLSKGALKFKLKGIDNPLAIHSGKLEAWPDLLSSIESTGLILYGRYIPVKRRPKRYFLFFWESLHIPGRGAFLNKVYGYKAKGKKYLGLLDRLKGEKIGKSAILIPAQHKHEVIQLLERYKVDYRILEL